MTHLDAVPVWAAIAAALLLLAGAGLTLLGTIGLVRLPGFYERIHAPTLGTSWGAAGDCFGAGAVNTELCYMFERPPAFVFADGFASGNTAAWSAQFPLP